MLGAGAGAAVLPPRGCSPGGCFRMRGPFLPPWALLCLYPSTGPAPALLTHAAVLVLQLRPLAGQAPLPRGEGPAGRLRLLCHHGSDHAHGERGEAAAGAGPAGLPAAVQRRPGLCVAGAAGAAPCYSSPARECPPRLLCSTGASNLRSATAAARPPCGKPCWATNSTGTCRRAPPADAAAGGRALLLAGHRVFPGQGGPCHGCHQAAVRDNCGHTGHWRRAAVSGRL